MARKPYTHRKKGAGRFVQLPEYILATEAWLYLKPGPRALYIELKRRYNGRNNGEIYLSHRDAARALNVHFNTVGSYFRELESHGFIRLTRGHCLGPNGIGEAARWALEELPTPDGKPATKGFIRWRNQIPATKTVMPRNSICYGAAETEGGKTEPVTNNGTAQP